MKTRISIILLAAFGFSFQLPQTAPFNDSILKQELRAELFFLAGNAMQGRLTASPENYLAEEYIKSRFESMGLKPAGAGGSYFQPLLLMTSTLGEGNLLEISAPPNAQLRLTPGQDYYPHNYAASGVARGQVVFAGFGITAPDLDYDDYRGGSVAGKIVLVLNDEPGEFDPASPFDGVVRCEASSPLRKALFAQQKGAAGILFVRDVHNHPGAANFAAEAARYWPEQPPRIPRYTLAAWADRIRIPAAEISPALATLMIQGTGKPLEAVSRSAESSTGIEPVPIPGVEVTITSNVRRSVISERNVVAVMEGSDPKVRDEHIIICAHHDHNGADGDLVYPGADDAGSSLIGVVQIAEAYGLAARAGQRPRRSIVFASWEAEERGLLGAWGYTEAPYLPLERCVAVLNMDMIGRNEEVPEGGGGRFRGLEIQTAESNSNSVNILGTLRSPDLKAESEKANQGIGLLLRFRYDNNPSNLMRRSDQWPFIQCGVPGIWVLTGLHPDYHTIYDLPEKINYDKMEKIVRMVHQMSWNLAQQDSRPKLLPRRSR